MWWWELTKACSFTHIVPALVWSIVPSPCILPYGKRRSVISTPPEANARVTTTKYAPIRIGNINSVLTRRKADTIRPSESIRHHPHVPRLGLKPVDLTRQLRLIPETLLIAIDRVREPDRPVRVHYDIVDRVEQSAVIAVQQSLDSVGRVRFHEYQATGLSLGTLIAEEDAGAVVDATVAHRHIGGDDFALPAAVLLSRRFTYFDRGCRSSIWWRQAAAGYVNGILIWDVDACFVRPGVVFLDRELDVRCCTEDVEECFVVDGEEWCG